MCTLVCARDRGCSLVRPISGRGTWSCSRRCAALVLRIVAVQCQGGIILTGWAKRGPGSHIGRIYSMSRPVTLAGVSNHWRLSCVPIRNVSPSLSPLRSSSSSPCFQSAMFSLSSAPSLTLVCAVRQEAHSPRASPHWARDSTTLSMWRRRRRRSSKLPTTFIWRRAAHVSLCCGDAQLSNFFSQHSLSSRLRLLVFMGESLCFFTSLNE